MNTKCAFKKDLEFKTTTQLPHHSTNKNDAFLARLKNSYSTISIQEVDDKILLQLQSDLEKNPNPVFSLSKTQPLSPKEKLEKLIGKEKTQEYIDFYTNCINNKKSILKDINSKYQFCTKKYEDTPEISIDLKIRIKSLHSFLNKVYRNISHNRKLAKELYPFEEGSFLEYLPSITNFNTANFIEQRLNPTIKDIIAARMIFKYSDEKGTISSNEEKASAISVDCGEELTQLEYSKFKCIEQKNMIDFPKPNGYQSYHLKFHYMKNYYELQLRTDLMEKKAKTHPDISHKGSYKPGEGGLNEFSIERCPIYINTSTKGNLQLCSKDENFQHFYEIDKNEYLRQLEYFQSTISEFRDYYKKHPEDICPNMEKDELTR